MMFRLIACGLSVGAALVYVFLFLPWRAESFAAFEQHRQVRTERLRLERELRPTRQVAVSHAPAPSLTELRRGIVAAVDASGLSGVRMKVIPARAGVAAQVQVSASGPYEAALRLGAELARPGRGLKFQSVRMTPTSDSAVQVDVMAAAGARP